MTAMPRKINNFLQQYPSFRVVKETCLTFKEDSNGKDLMENTYNIYYSLVGALPTILNVYRFDTIDDNDDRTMTTVQINANTFYIYPKAWHPTGVQKFYDIVILHRNQTFSDIASLIKKNDFVMSMQDFYPLP